MRRLLVPFMGFDSSTGHQKLGENKMSDECKCGEGCTCHTPGEGGGTKDVLGEGGKTPYIKECKCGSKCKKDVDEE